MPTFYGGIEPVHPWPPKEQLLESTTDYQRISPEYVVLPMRQGIGAPCTPLVQEGERVCVGQLVGSSDAKISSLVHASVSGTVGFVGDMPEAGGGHGQAIVIQNDRKDTPAPPIDRSADAGALPPGEITDIVRKAGIVGMGGARFPTHVKLEPNKPVDLVIVNGCECEPMQAADEALMVQNPGAILAGVQAALRAVGARQALVAIEDNKPGAIEALRRESKSLLAVEIRSLATHYPQGGEKQLIQTLTGREVPLGGLPADAGVLVLNAATCAAIGDAVQKGRPLTHRLCTVTGDVAVPRNLMFPIGTPAASMIDACGGIVGTPSKVIMGGPMMGQTLEDITVPCLKGTNGLIVVNEDNDSFFGENDCIRCNRCVDACPMKLMPLFIDRAWRAKKVKRCEQLQAQSCINCGCCTYVCPARIRLAQKITEARNEIVHRQKEAQ